MTYRIAGIDDAAALSEFAYRVFMASFERQVDRSELDAFARPRFAAEKVRTEIADPRNTIFLALDPDIIGYAHVAVGDRPACELPGHAPAELKRIYVDETWHGRGVAQELMHLVEADAAAKGCDVLWLAVWDGNARGRAFYQKCGFSTAGFGTFQVGRLTLQHYFLAKPLRDLP